MADTLTIRGIWGGMSDETAAAILSDLRRGSPEVYREALAGAARAQRMRLPALQKQPAARQAASIRRALTRLDLQEAGAQILIEWLTKHQQPMLTQFLDDLGIAHEEGTVKDDVGAQPEAARLHVAVEHLYQSFPPEQVRVYLSAFSLMTAHDWPTLPTLLERQQDAELGTLAAGGSLSAASANEERPPAGAAD